MARVVVITGTDTGIGRSLVGVLDRAGDDVTGVGRFHGNGMVADLSNLAEVRRVASRIARALPTIDLLVNNAGIHPGRRVLSADGFESAFATNYLGHFLLTQLLLGQLEAARGRVVNLTSVSHRFGDLRRAPLDDIARGRAWRCGLQAYLDSKLANLLFTLEAARRWRERGISVDAVHPGILWTGIWKEVMLAARWVVRPFAWMMKGPDNGAAVVARVAASAGTGRYFNTGRETRPGGQGCDTALARVLWEESMAWVRGAA